MDLVAEGIILGLGLSILLGPIFIVLIQSSMEYGAKAGFIAASGIWISDIIFIGLALNFVKRISPIIHDAGFVFWAGLLGGLVLIGVGIATFFKKPILALEKKKITTSSFISLWIQGFTVNTINPFSIIFWFSLITTRVGGRLLTEQESWVYTGTILFMIILTDSAKVLFAKWIKHRIRPDLLNKLNKLAGIALVIFGLVMLVKSVAA